jgi:hypothetical protein
MPMTVLTVFIPKDANAINHLEMTHISNETDKAADTPLAEIDVLNKKNIIIH